MNVQVVSTERQESEVQARAELEGWRRLAVPDTAAPLDASDLARLVPDCFSALGIDAGVGAGFSVNTVHFYRRKNVLDAPLGKTSAARYALRHLWQAVGARLAGQLGLVTLAEAREIMRGATDDELLDFVAARMVDARARRALRDAPPAERPAAAKRALSTAPTDLRPLPSIPAATDRAAPYAERFGVATIIPLPGDAWCMVPATHPAHHSMDAARELVHALADALRIGLDTQADGG